jgi:hypothetical protein
MLCLSYYLLCFLFNKIGEEEGGNRFSPEVAGDLGGGHKQCIHLSKCKNDKIKGEEKKSLCSSVNISKMF